MYIIKILRVITVIYLIFWIYLILLISENNWCVSFNDFFGFANSDIVSFYKNSFWPSGYPLLIKCSELLTDDKLLAGRSISLVSTFILIICFYQTFRKSYEIISLIAIITFLSSNFYIFANYECSDVTGTMFFCLGLMNTFLFINSNKTFNLSIGCALLGLSCCFRHQYLIPCVIVLLIIIVLHYKYLNKKSIINLLIFFLLGISPHAIPSLIYSGSIFSTSHSANLLFVTLPNDQQTFGIGMMDIMNRDISTLELFSNIEFLKGFFRNYIGNIIDFITQTISGQVISYFAFAGTIFLFTEKKYKLLLIIASLYLSFILTVSTFRFDIRYYLPLITISCLLSSFFILRIYSISKSFIEKYLVVFTPLSIIIFTTLWSTYRPLLYNPKRSWLQTPIEVQNHLESIGLNNSKEVLSFSHHFHNTNSPSKERYEIPWLSSNFNGWYSALEILQYCKKNDIRYIVYHNFQYSIGEVKGLNNQILLELESLVPYKKITSKYTIIKI